MAFLPSNMVYTEQLAVFLLDEWSDFSVLQSSIHECWVRRYASTLKTDVRYIPTDCYGTFPFPEFANTLDGIGQRYHNCRGISMISHGLGMTKLYNRFHNPNDVSEEMLKIRLLHSEMDCAVAVAYGWSDLVFDHNFVETNKGTRYTISEGLRSEIGKRLLILNLKRCDA
jgi:hypothetical protein